MDMGTVGWIVLGWFSVALVLSLVLGGFLRKVNEALGEEDIAASTSRQKGMRFMRSHNSRIACGKATASRVRVLVKRAAG